MAYRLRKPVVLITGYGGWVDKIAEMDYMDERQSIRFLAVSSAEDAVDKLLKKLAPKASKYRP